MHRPRHLYYSESSSGFCYDRAQSAWTRRSPIENAAGTGTVILPAHFATPTAGRVESAAGGLRFAFRG